MSDEVTLVSKSRRAHTIVLDHDAFRTKQHGFKVRSLKFSNDRRVRHPTPGVLTIQPGERIENLHPAIASLPQVKKLIADREVAIDESPRGDSKAGSSQSPGPVAPDDPPQDDKTRATLGRRVRVEKGT